MCNLLKVLLIFLGIIHNEKILADNMDVVFFQADKIKYYHEYTKKEDIGIEFIKIPKIREINDICTIYSDVLGYSQQKPFGNESGRHINVHETVHGIHSDVRNQYQKILKYKLNAFYCLDGNIIILKESNISIRHVIKFVPLNLRSYRWNLYFVKQLDDWNDQPSYILDEWVAYILSSKCAVEDHKKGIITHKSDAISGCLDFSIYATALAIAVKKHDSDYWDNNPSFKQMIKYNLVQAEKTLGSGLDIEAFNSQQQDLLYNRLLYDEESEEIRSFLIEEFDGILIY